MEPLKKERENGMDGNDADNDEGEGGGDGDGDDDEIDGAGDVWMLM